MRFRAMGSECQITGPALSGPALEAARALIQSLERSWSRFLESSEISWMNRRTGRPTFVSRATAGLLRRACYAAHHTDGLFSPFLLRELEDLGYDQTHREVQCWHSADSLVALEDPADIVELADGCAIDPGGIGKGYAADLVATLLAPQAQPAHVVVNLGGDLRIAGTVPTDEPIEVEVLDPWNDREVTAALKVSGGAVATSSTLRRRWTGSDGVERHHLLDPRTRRPAESDLVAATVIAGEAWWAEALAKAAVIGGSGAARKLVTRHRVSALLTSRDGSVESVGVGELVAAP